MSASTDSIAFTRTPTEMRAPKRVIPLEAIAEIVRSGLELEAMTRDEIRIMLQKYSSTR